MGETWTFLDPPPTHTLFNGTALINGHPNYSYFWTKYKHIKDVIFCWPVSLLSSSSLSTIRRWDRRRGIVTASSSLPAVWRYNSTTHITFKCNGLATAPRGKCFISTVYNTLCTVAIFFQGNPCMFYLQHNVTIFTYMYVCHRYMYTKYSPTKHRHCLRC